MTKLKVIPAAVAVALAVMASMVMVATPAHAVPTCDDPVYYYWIDSSQNLHARHTQECWNNWREWTVNHYVEIQRYLSPGVWTTVASGRGDITYFCNGSALNIYRVVPPGGDGFFNACG